ncbi:MAG TPA: DUF4242 domain-containing protein [Gaiellaceae bacterium]|nr:DUF4242 domain-containing protein [Gaiellaceae bacterium]
MPRYLVKRTFPGGLALLANDAGADALHRVCDQNAVHGVDWLHSYVTADKETTFCVYDAPDPEAIRAAAEANGLPVDAITPVSVLVPHFYR